VIPPPFRTPGVLNALTVENPWTSTVTHRHMGK
jgi:hypothetical protein